MSSHSKKIAVKAFIVKDKKVLLLQGGRQGWWEFPGGKLEFGEDPKVGLKRELQEELGIDTISIENIIDSKARIVDFGEENHPYYIVYIIYRCSITDDHFSISDEHDDGKWFLKEEVKSLPMWEGYREVVLENME